MSNLASKTFLCIARAMAEQWFSNKELQFKQITLWH